MVMKVWCVEDGGWVAPTGWWNISAQNVRLLLLRHNTKTLASELIGSLFWFYLLEEGWYFMSEDSRWFNIVADWTHGGTE